MLNCNVIIKLRIFFNSFEISVCMRCHQIYCETVNHMPYRKPTDKKYNAAVYIRSIPLLFYAISLLVTEGLSVSPTISVDLVCAPSAKKIERILWLFYPNDVDITADFS